MTNFPGLIGALSDEGVDYVIVGGGSYEELESHSATVELFGHDCLCVDLPRLIELKRAAGRPRDLEVIAELEALLDESER